MLQKCEITIGRSQQPVREIALFTDGLLNLIMDTSSMEPHPPFFNNLGNWLREYEEPEHPGRKLLRILGSEQVAKRTDDDVTLLMAVRTDRP